MKCQLNTEKLKVFCKSIRVFAKLSNEVLISADTNGIKLQSINELKTAFIEIQFFKTFFTLFECNVETKCKLFLKSLILVFRFVKIDKSVDTCTLLMDESMARVVFEMNCRNGVNREYFLPYMESSSLRYASNRSRTVPSFKVNSKQMSECLRHFSNETKDISVWLTSDQILFKSYSDDIEEQNIITSFAYKSQEFQSYDSTNETSVTFNLKDLKSFIEFVSFKNQSIDCYFESSGKPIEFVANTDDKYWAKMLLATHDFPEDECPVPPTQTFNQTSNNSLLCSGDLNEEELGSAVPNTCLGSSTELPLIQSNISDSINESNIHSNDNNDNLIQANDGTEEENPFDEEDNDIINQLLTQMPEFSSDEAEPKISLTGSPLERYHRNVLYGNEDDDDLMGSSQDNQILVADSDED